MNAPRSEKYKEVKRKNNMADEIIKYQNAVDIIKTAILQSQARAAKAKSSVATDEITKINTSDNSAVATADFTDDAEIRQLQLANWPNFPLCRIHHAGLPSAYGRCHI